MKRFMLILLVAVMVLTMVACEKEATSSESLPPNGLISENTPIGTEIPESSVYTDGEYASQQEAIGGDGLRWTNHKYSDKIASISFPWEPYILECTKKTIDELWKTEWRCEDGSAFSLIEVVDELDVSREKFEKLNNDLLELQYKYINEYGADITEEIIFRDICFTEEEIDIIYSKDKRRVAEAFAFPYAVVADNWELYPLRWIIDNPATLYKEREISLEAIQKSVDKIIEDGLVGKADKEALLARIEEYKKLL